MLLGKEEETGLCEMDIDDGEVVVGGEGFVVVGSGDVAAVVDDLIGLVPWQHVSGLHSGVQ